MPELIEVETYRRQAEAVVGRTIADAPALDPLGLRGADPDHVRAQLVGRRIEAAERIGKLLLLPTDGPVLGLRFGMTGRLLVDGGASIDGLLHGGQGDDPAWDRYVLTFTDGTDLRIRDPRRLGGLQLDPDTSWLGPEASTVTADELATVLAGSRTAVKARLLDQAHLAGLGNLLVDETLWRAGIDPARTCDEVAPAEVPVLAEAIRTTVAELTRRGGSHTGDLQAARVPGASCPRDGTPLERATVGGRTTYRCPRHQR
ncbi:formamidopyrimidine-DNA glycosylase [Acidimicrobiia bacterium EGI L10123]|uniref:Fpg/Nei family DNA glycosylase n=1 Tax=Salinilacustrithrix flava TaxID=2957203 RepID=UPI003D7C35D5|nr:formamidopyrimidine-DNA glycosylase [Acidimicrobiia bacterium EGI L10123]